MINVVRILPYGAPLSDPAFGPTAGRALIEIYGGDFRLAPIPPLDELTPGATFPQTVEVLFDGIPSPSVRVPRSNLLRVITPASPLPFDPTEIPLFVLEPDRDKVQVGHAGRVDVIVRNLDDNGDPIGGESVTVVDGYAYVNPPIGGPLAAVSDTTLKRVVDAVVFEFRRSVWPETINHQSVDYDSDGTELRIIDIARLPSVTLLGPRTETSRQYEIQGEQTYDSSIAPGQPSEDLFLLGRMPYALDLLFDVVGMTRERGTALNLMHVATDFVQRTPRISIIRDPANPDRGSVEYQFAFEELNTTFDISSGVNNSDLHSFRGSIRIKGIQIERIPIFGDAGNDAVPEIDVIELNTCPFIP